MLAVEGADARMIEGVIVKATQPIPPRIVRPHPLLETFLDALLFLACGFGCLGVDDWLLVSIEVVNGGRLEVQSIFDEFKAGVSVRAPIRRVCCRAPCFPIAVHMPSTER